MLLRALLTILIPTLVSAFHLRLTRILVTEGQLPRRFNRLIFAWGAIGAIGLSLAFQLAVKRHDWPAYPAQTTRMMYEGALAGPLIEECAKAAPLLFMLVCTGIRSRRAFLSAGIISGSGFFFTETIISLMGVAGTATWTGEVVGGCLVRGFSHPSFCGFSGIGFGISAASRNRVVKAVSPLLGLSAAFIAHAINNTLGIAAMHGMARQATVSANRFALFLILFYLGLFLWLRRRASRRAHTLPANT